MSGSFEPIAIIGQGCVLPGALTPSQLWEVFRTGTDVTSTLPENRWRLAKSDVLRKGPDGAVSDRGGYVRDFEKVFNPDGFALSPEKIRGLDTSVHWLLHAGREALKDAQLEGARRKGLRIGAIMGNLSFPTDGLARWTESHWLEGSFLKGIVERPDPANRFMSGLPALLLAEALGLDAGAFALDAACASSLYAIKLACDRLHDRRADAMLAGAVCRSDDLFIHVGFTALQALSPTGRSRPFHRGADGLLPAEGAALLVLKRLDDAIAAGDPIAGVIRGVGLSNDGRSSGLLVPSSSGQIRAVRTAYDVSGLQPSDVSLLECHATGTPLGDATEIETMSAVFAGQSRVPIGSAKSNLGHALTVAGAAGIMKVLGAMKSRLRPASLSADEPIPAFDKSPFHLLAKAEPWDVSGPRRAGVSAFGFGGNNAHVLVEEWIPAKPPRGAPTAPPGDDIAIVAVGACVGDGQNVGDFTDALLKGSVQRQAKEVALQLEGLRFPPSDLSHTLAQQLLVLRAAGEAIGATKELPTERTGVYVGMQCDAVIARGGLRARLAEFVRSKGQPINAEWLEAARAASGDSLTAAGVVGKMPNIVTNRINRQFDLAGPSFSVSSEELSGLDALEIGCRALNAGEIDAAVIGAVDLSCEPAHEAAARAALPADRQTPGDAAVVLVLKRLADARRDGDEVWATLPADSSKPSQNAPSLAPVFGHAHAASGLLHVAAAAIACRHRLQLDGLGPWPTTAEAPSIGVSVTPMLGTSRQLTVAADRKTAPLSSWTEDVPRFYVFSGTDRREVLSRLASGRTSNEGPARLVLLCTEAQLPKKKDEARKLVESGVTPARGTRLGDGIFFREKPIQGDVGFVFTGPAGAYSDMGRELLLAFPELMDGLTRFGELDDAYKWVFDRPEIISSNDRLWGASFLTQLHAIFTREVLGLKPQAAIGFCSGETNALFAMGAWSDMSALRQEILDEQVYEREIGGEFAVAGRAWKKRGLGPGSWESWRITADEERVREALSRETDAHLTIVNAPGDFIVAGRAEACARVIASVGSDKAQPLGYNVTIHSPEMEEYAPTWRKLHHRKTTSVPGVRFYTHSTCSSYEPNADSVADALLGQALHTVDFPKLIRKTWDDGVRVFIEHGPQGGCSSWIRRTLGDKEHLAVPLDIRGESSFTQPLRTIAELIAVGVPVDVERFNARLDRIRPAKPAAKPQKTWPAHPPEIQIPVPPPIKEVVAPVVVPPPAPLAAPQGVHAMPLPPWIPPILGAQSVPFVPVIESAPEVVEQIALPVSEQDYETMDSNRLLLERFQQHTAALTQAHQKFVETAAGAFKTYLSASASGVGAQVGGPHPLPLVAALPPEGRAVSPPPSTPVLASVPVAETALPSGGRAATNGSGWGPPPPAPKPAPRLKTQTERRLEAHTIERTRKTPVGPQYSREQLEVLAGGEISSVFGPLFKGQDQYTRQVRMPMPPLLLADRVTGIDAKPGVLSTGVMWTETDVRADSWYLNDGYMPMGILIESGQADLLLISWMGVDALNKSERVYRLLGCELMLHGGLPKIGDTLEYEIHIDGHANQGDVRLFFFHYDLRVNGQLRMTVRNGQAGFFTDDELNNSAGVLWNAATAEYSKTATVPPPKLKAPSHYSTEQIVAFTEGRVFDCFGPGFEITQAQVRPPKIQGGKMRLFDEVVEMNPTGGPWKRGYMKARAAITPDHWTMQGHFKNDPCMPGTLMCEAGFQCMSFYLTALGYTLDKDGWRFEPAANELYDLKCRGQVTPTSKELTYELFVEEITEGVNTTLYVDLLGTVDGRAAFHGRRLAVKLVQDWPISTRGDALANYVEQRPVAKLADGFAFDFKSIMNAAWGRPADAFGPTAASFEGWRKIPRLPGAPYLFMTRVAKTEGEFLSMKSGAVAHVEYDVPTDDWYFRENGYPTMPIAVLMEAALQPCGWLTAYVGCPFKAPMNLSFRNLEGTATVLGEILPTSGRLDTKAKITTLVNNGDTMLEAFDVLCSVGDQPVYKMNTRFGHFLPESLVTQIGLPVTDTDRARLTDASDTFVDLEQRPAQYFGGSLRLAKGQLLMIDRITGVWPEGGKKGLGRIRAERSIHPSDWFFKLHFYEDPVQAGSLGIEAMVQLVQSFMLARGMGEGIPNARFEPLAVGREFKWKYRGQVSPHNKTVVVEGDITSFVRDEKGVLVTIDASLWCDGLRIYEAIDFPMRIVAGEPTPSYKPISSLKLFTATGNTPDELIRQLDRIEHAQPDPKAPFAVALVASDAASLRAEIELARKGIASGSDWQTPNGSCFTPTPLGRDGKLAFVYPGAFSAYAGVAGDAFRIFPWLKEPGHGLPKDPETLFQFEEEQSDDVAIFSASAATSVLYTRVVTETFRLQPQLAFGYSLGEGMAFSALGVWDDPDLQRERLHASDLFRSRLAGSREALREFWKARGVTCPPGVAPWATYVVKGPIAQIRAAVSKTKNVFVTIVNTPTEAVIGGWPAECEKLVSELNFESMFVPFAQLLHSEVVASEQPEIARQHRFTVRSQPSVTFLSATGDAPYALETEALATRLAQMAREPLDFPALVERAYGAGARVFLELGGGSTTSRLVAANLKGRPNVTINIDRKDVDVQTSVLRALARLFVHRVPVDLSALGGQS